MIAPYHVKNTYAFNKAAADILYQAVVVKCRGTWYNPRLLAFLEKNNTDHVKGLFEQVGLPPVASGSLGLDEDDDTFFALDQKVESEFDIATHLQITKRQVRVFTIEFGHIKNSTEITAVLEKSMRMAGRCESKSFKVQYNNPFQRQEFGDNLLSCTAYFSR
ncbi:MAG: hypothetical protein FWE17_00295 [Alphaproteobacteria bacterium]|nr:hypothetical protein [Alphaproteobacteria bacterium]MCL2757750.1 hypothetical protein [Alphaproteobacteria bacterium]